MTETTLETIRHLLQPTHDFAGWHAQAATLDPDQAIPILAAIMADTSEAEGARGEAATLLGLLRDERTRAPLLAGLRLEASLVRARAALALAQLGAPDDETMHALVTGLSDEDYFVRECCARVLGVFKRPDVVPALERMRDSDSVASNREAAKAAIRAIREQGEG